MNQSCILIHFYYLFFLHVYATFWFDIYILLKIGKMLNRKINEPELQFDTFLLFFIIRLWAFKIKYFLLYFVAPEGTLVDAGYCALKISRAFR